MIIINEYRLCQILSVLPGSSVDCERGFSNLNRIKRDDRNRLDGDHLGWLMRISSYEIPQTEFHKLHMGPLIRSWKTEKERRSGEKDDIRIN